MSLGRKKSPDEMEQLFGEYHALLCLVSFGILKDRDAAKDVVQDFFISYWQRQGSISITISFKAYAIKAVKNLSLLSLRKREKEKSLLQDITAQAYEDPKVLDLPNEIGKVQKLLNQLPERRREIFVSAILYGQTYAEIAEMKGISINTVKTQIKRSYAFLRTEVAENFIQIIVLNLLFF